MLDQQWHSHRTPVVSKNMFPFWVDLSLSSLVPASAFFAAVTWMFVTFLGGSRV